MTTAETHDARARARSCRVCREELHPEPLLRYENMPGAAQHLPDADSLKSDTGIELRVFQCPACGLIQLDNDPVPYHRDVIRAAAFSEGMQAFRLEQFREFIERHSLQRKKILEVGCGGGEYLAILQQLEVQAHGVENAPQSAAQCLEHGLQVTTGFVDGPAYDVPGSPFDAFFLLSFLEHIPNPVGTLKGICHNIGHNAVGLVEVPNFDMVLQRNLFSEFTRDHLLYFTRQTLCTTLRLSGFDVLESDTVWFDYIIAATVRRRPATDLSRFRGSQSKLVEEINRYVDQFPPKKVAIWGAGHQALAIIAMADLSHKIRYVVDSATFKQGRYTPATHLPIVSPESLNADPVDAIIVMAASYSDEVAQIIRDRHGATLQVAILRDFGLESA